MMEARLSGEETPKRRRRPLAVSPPPPPATSAEVAERLGRLEAQQESTLRAIDAIMVVQQDMHGAMQELSRQIAELAAALRHPDPALCCRQRELRELHDAQQAHASRTTVLEQANARMLGAIAVLLGLPSLVWTVLQILRAVRQ